jgi:transcription initiation factor IIE alpha subunit
MKQFNCPHCGEEIEKSLINRFFASIGGSKSKRKLTKEQSQMMAEARRLKKLNKEGE